ncbi:hypothetical protein GGX14DRAFT_542928 [Mycena pura]|uniref:Uncharacterized protein n=1 Tax=Mycena pura TaxID=153505 RepID=A0AAD6VMB7_9AGAR|nr:hypothetical protein GGX14DRAFT_542928 [Mycena pura]
MRREGELVMLAVECVADGNFEAIWDATDMERKRELVLEGLYCGACNAQSDDIRADCPEMTVAGLAGNSDLMLLSTTTPRVRELYWFKHPQVEQWHRTTSEVPDMLKAFLHNLVLRNFYIVETLQGIGLFIQRANFTVPNKAYERRDTPFSVDPSYNSYAAVDEERKGRPNLCADCQRQLGELLTEYVQQSDANRDAVKWKRLRNVDAKWSRTSTLRMFFAQV